MDITEEKTVISKCSLTAEIFIKEKEKRHIKEKRKLVFIKLYIKIK
jgi:hypothetical protein